MNATYYLTCARVAETVKRKRYFYAMYISHAMAEITMAVPDGILEDFMPEAFVAFGETIAGDINAGELTFSRIQTMKEEVTKDLN